MIKSIASSMMHTQLNTLELAVRGRLPKINFGDLKKICRMKIKDFHSYGERFNTDDGPYFYKDNGADILAVAHLDTVLGFHHFTVTKMKQDTLIHCTTLDDRLGAYTILKYLPSLGLKYDILLTTGEENQNSTAAYFEPPKGKKYKWIFSFDLQENGCKMYQFESKEGKAAIEAVGLKLQPNFAYSDIVNLEHLKAQAFNFGVGYYNHHTMYAAASKKIWLSQIRSFIQFFRNNKNVSFPYLPKYNIFSLVDGFEYDPKVRADYFDEQEYEFCQQLLYEASNKGLSPEAFDTRLTKSVVRKAIQFQATHGVSPYEGDKEITSKIVGEIKPITRGSEDGEFRMGLGVIQHPVVKPGEITPEEIQRKIRKAGGKPTMMEVCGNCGDEYKHISGMITDRCPNCREHIIVSERNRRSQTQYPLSSVERKQPLALPPVVKEAKIGRLKTKIPLERKGEELVYALSTEAGQKVYKWKPRLKIGFEPVPEAQSKQV